LNQVLKKYVKEFKNELKLMDEDEDEPDDDYNKSAVGGSAGFDEIE
jgi:hypothetical protein